DACPCTFMQPVLDFFSSIFQGIADFFKPIFDFFSGKTGTTTGTGTGSGVQHSGAGAAIVFSTDIPAEVYQGLTVNPAKIAETPARLDPALIQHIANTATPPIQIGELLTQFDRICDLVGVGVDDVLYQDQGTEITRANARRSLETNYLQMVRDNAASGTQYYRNIAADIDIALKGIIFGLRVPADGSPETPDIIAKKRMAIENLCSASEHCVPRRHTEAFKVYRVLSNQMETLDEIIKQYIQETKEDLFINYYSLSTQSGHTLNFIRRAVGNEFGLDTSQTNLQDPYIEMGGNNARSPENRFQAHTQPDQFRNVFQRIYTPANILFNMKNFLNGRIASDAGFARDISQFIDNEIGAHETAGRLTAADTADMPMPYQNDYSDANPFHLTDAGIKFLMVHFQHLNSATPNGHLVRAAAATT
ncbi:MAG: hypothetical protein JSR93_00885, partial [Verrucomicrobia bacterium]|nr:hypothetical protein [Verrucomicrobiota bacterium]